MEHAQDGTWELLSEEPGDTLQPQLFFRLLYLLKYMLIASIIMAIKTDMNMIINSIEILLVLLSPLPVFIILKVYHFIKFAQLLCPFGEAGPNNIS